MTIPPQSAPDIYEYAVPDNGITCPLLVDLPHGGRTYPPDFNFSCLKSDLELCEERYLDELFNPPVVNAGGVVLMAKFPRTYVDPNRAINDIDQLLFETPWMEPTALNGRSQHGHGTIMRLIRAGEPIYNRPLSHDEAINRIKEYYSIYHNTLNGLLNHIHEKFNTYYHLSAHSMPSSVLVANFPYAPPDIILGDLDGRTCGLEFRQQAAELLRKIGYRVAINQIYKGAEIVNRYGQPAWQRHSLQIEINRALFHNEKTGEKLNNFNTLKHDIQEFVKGLNAEISR